MKKIRTILLLGASFTLHALPPRPSISAANQELLSAVQAENITGVKQALKKKANPNYAPSNGITPLMDSAEAGNLPITQSLLKAKATVDQQDQIEKRTALMRAAEQGHLAVIKELLKAKANLKLKDRDGRTAYDHAIKNGFPNCASLLMPPDKIVAY